MIICFTAYLKQCLTNHQKHFFLLKPPYYSENAETHKIQPFSNLLLLICMELLCKSFAPRVLQGHKNIRGGLWISRSKHTIMFLALHVAHFAVQLTEY